MIAFLDGVVAMLEEDALVIEVGGIGWRVFAPAHTVGRFAVGARARVFTVQQVREDAMMLYGFETDAERRLFSRLQDVTGIGPRLALQILNHLRPEEIVGAVLREDAKALSRAPGIGQKTAQRMVLELKDRLGGVGIGGTDSPSQDRSPAGGSSADSVRLTEVRSALLGLGYTDREADRLFEGSAGDLQAAPDLQGAVRLALRKLQGL